MFTLLPILVLNQVSQF
uniref:Uncharacterized protein n=1 Tax=Rhizophora mucronata TaxID=61149 RepID=A0A2P2PUC1_RHIMU